ncbi:hypothetical protein HJG60_011824 [Phyllostomus discolor]|uniref:Uncharacterized protein n=1 Tax=Phyllostomus discolor TaxID=89673 RepID=A0A833ZCZ3_9CHIR|nr:hypothetical protein HJG60_011824 [Phyllostomus discolor]
MVGEILKVKERIGSGTGMLCSDMSICSEHTETAASHANGSEPFLLAVRAAFHTPNQSRPRGGRHHRNRTPGASQPLLGTVVAGASAGRQCESPPQKEVGRERCPDRPFLLCHTPRTQGNP